MGVADEPNAVPVVLGQLVRSGAGDVESGVLRRRALRRNDCGKRQGQLVEEITIRLGQVDGHGARRVVRLDSAREIARARIPRTRFRADDPPVVGDLVVAVSSRVEAFEGVQDVARPDDPAVREANPWPQLERVRLSPVGGGRDGPREVRHERPAQRASNAFVADEPVVDVRHQLPSAIVPGDLGVETLAVRKAAQRDTKDSAPMAYRRRHGSRPDGPVRKGDADRAARQLDRLHRSSALYVDLGQSAVVDVRHPQRAFPEGKCPGILSSRTTSVTLPRLGLILDTVAS